MVDGLDDRHDRLHHHLDRLSVLARAWGTRGDSFIGFFLLSLLFFPLALILAYVVKPR